MRFWTFFIALVCLIGVVRGFAVNVDAHEEECFYDDVTLGARMGLTFQVAEGGFLDIDVTVLFYSVFIRPLYNYK